MSQKLYRSVAIIILIVIAATFLTILPSCSAYRETGYYIGRDALYYCDGYDGSNEGYEWWRYSDADEEWRFLQYVVRSKRYPQFVDDNSPYTAELPFKDHPEYTDDTFGGIKKSRAYKSIHHTRPATAYYNFGGYYYYYLHDAYGGYYGDTKNGTGWYRYDPYASAWEYYGSDNDKELLGDLWYDADAYYMSDVDNDLGTSWYNTEYYANYQSAYDSYRAETQAHSNNGYHWSDTYYDTDDNVYNWNSDDDWYSDDRTYQWSDNDSDWSWSNDDDYTWNDSYDWKDGYTWDNYDNSYDWDSDWNDSYDYDYDYDWGWDDGGYDWDSDW